MTTQRILARHNPPFIQVAPNAPGYAALELHIDWRCRGCAANPAYGCNIQISEYPMSRPQFDPAPYAAHLAEKKARLVELLAPFDAPESEEHTSELQSQSNLVC